MGDEHYLNDGPDRVNFVNEIRDIVVAETAIKLGAVLVSMAGGRQNID